MQLIKIVMLLFVCQTALASTFDVSTGRLTLDPDGVGLSFDDVAELSSEYRASFTNNNNRPISLADVAAYYEADEFGLEGSGAFRFGGHIFQAFLFLDHFAQRFADRRVEFKLWQKPSGTLARVELEWSASGAGNSRLLGRLLLRPSGRATDDGWIEYSSGPVDFSAGGSVGPLYMVLIDQQLIDYLRFDYAGVNPELSTLIDAFEIVDLGPAAVAPVACTRGNEAQNCAPAGLCLYGRCVDAALVTGAAPQDDAIRAAYLDRKLFDYKTFEGGRRPRQHFAQLQQSLDTLRASANSAAWGDVIKNAIEGTGDGHSYAPLPGSPATGSIEACLNLGTADLLPDAPMLPIVFSIASNNPVTTLLEPGDALVAIDDMPPAAWTQLGARYRHYGGDPAGEAYVAAPELMRAAVLGGSKLSFARCPSAVAPDFTPCTQAQLDVFDIDLATLIGQPLWNNQPPSWGEDDIECDYRFTRSSSGQPSQDGTQIATASTQRGVLLQFNGLPAYQQPGGSAWYSKVTQVLNQAPAKLVLDQRMGVGGHVFTVGFMAALLTSAEDFYATDSLPALEQNLDTALRQQFLQCIAVDDFCGGFERWIPEQQCAVSCTRGVAASSKLALINGSDRSGNDFLSKILGFRSAETRIFGAVPSWGAFGPIQELPAHFGETDGGAVQCADSLFLRTSTDNNTDFASGLGVAPDVVVLQKQSDVLRGVDTVMEAAWAWLNEE